MKMKKITFGNHLKEEDNLFTRHKKTNIMILIIKFLIIIKENKNN